MFRPFTIICAALVSGFMTINVQAACTYSEAVMAFNNGNIVRGQALMNMAARDGDKRAVRFLAQNNANKNRSNGKALSDLLLVMDSQETSKSKAEKVN